MVSWGAFEEAEPEFATRVRAIFALEKSKVLATLRADGAPRVSGIEIGFEGEELVFGSMPEARKGADLQRDARFALHSAPRDWSAGSGPPGDVKIAGRAVGRGPLTGEITGEGFRVDLTEVVVTSLNEEATMLCIESWRPGRGLRRVERS